MNDAGGDPIFGLLARLPGEMPRQAAADRVRVRSHAMLASCLQPRVGVSHCGGLAARMVDGALYGVCFLYLAGAVAQALRLGRLIE